MSPPKKRPHIINIENLFQQQTGKKFMPRLGPPPSYIGDAITSKELERIETCRGIARNLTQKERSLSSVLNQISGVNSRIDDTGRRLTQYQYRLRDEDDPRERNNIANIINSLEEQISDFSSRKDDLKQDADNLRGEIADLQSEASAKNCNFA